MVILHLIVAYKVSLIIKNSVCRRTSDLQQETCGARGNSFVWVGLKFTSYKENNFECGTTISKFENNALLMLKTSKREFCENEMFLFLLGWHYNCLNES